MLDWLREQESSDQPYVMMYMHKAPHRPWWPTTEKFAEPTTLFDDCEGRGERTEMI
ncbi:MAG: hypothetical protein WA952_08470 [Lewinella sp.]